MSGAPGPSGVAPAVVAAARRRLVVGLAVVAVAAPAVLLAVRYPRWWVWVAQEQTPMTWLQGVVLVVAAAAAATVRLLLRLRDGDPGTARTWLFVAAGLAALAFDEQFSVHERVRDGFLAPRDVRVPFLPWVAAGDFLLLVVAAVGLACLPRIWRAVRVDPLAARLLGLGVVLALAAVGVDSIDPGLWSVEGERIQQSAEEVVELAAGLCLLGAVGLRLLTLLGEQAARAAD